jgi:hypothetical protein
MPDVVVTRVQTSGPPRRSRNLEERVMVLAPAQYQRLAIIFRRLRPRSRLRRAALRRASVSGWAAFNRGDFELMLVRYAPEVEFHFSHNLQTLGLDGTYRGHKEMLDGMRELAADWDPIELEPAYVLDLGDAVLNLGFIRARGRASGARVETEIAQLVAAPDGVVTSDRAWDTWEQGLRAAGLDPDTITLPQGDRPGATSKQP